MHAREHVYHASQAIIDHKVLIRRKEQSFLLTTDENVVNGYGAKEPRGHSSALTSDSYPAGVFVKHAGQPGCSSNCLLKAAKQFFAIADSSQVGWKWRVQKWNGSKFSLPITWEVVRCTGQS